MGLGNLPGPELYMYTIYRGSGSIAMFDKNFVVIRGGGDIASGIAFRLFNAGFKVLILEISKPSLIRRKVSFAQAVYDKKIYVEEICAILSGTLDEALSLSEDNTIPVLVDEELNNFKNDRPFILVDAILAKKNIGTKRDMADVVIGVGPGFTAGVDVDAVIETQRGNDLGNVIIEGSAQPNTGIPGVICGYGQERVLRSPKEGNIRIIKDIGSVVERGEIVAEVDGTEIKSSISGVVRGMIQNGYHVTKNMKIADVDPRLNIEYCYKISDKAHAVGSGVLEAILHLTKQNYKC